MEDQNQSQPTQEAPAPDQQPEQPVTVTPAPATGGGSSKKGLLVAVIILLLLAIGAAAYFLVLKKDDPSPAATGTNQAQQPASQPEAGEGTQAAAIDCGDGYSVFANREFGAAFCYPNDWGNTVVEDAKFEAADTGNRQVIKFSRQPQIVVGGVSDDWSTALGRGGSCLAPTNQPAEAREYNVEWHDITDHFAKRSMETSAGGYDLTEMVGTFDNGVCAVGHKVIDGSRYRVVSASYFAEFTNAVASADDHIYNSYELFRETERFELDKLLASLEAY